jgi:hypothetical protein
MVIGLGSTSTPLNLPPRRPADLRNRRNVFRPRMVGHYPKGYVPKWVCRICGCSDEDPCAGGCGRTQAAPGDLPMCLACLEFRAELQDWVEDGRVTKGGVVRLYREARARIQARRQAELLAEAEKEPPPRLIRRAAAGGR